MHASKAKRLPWQILKSVVFALFLRELKTRFGTYKQGYVWLLLEPVAHVLVLSFLFGYLRSRTLFAIDYPVFIVTGIVPFLTFKNIALRIMDAVEGNRGLFTFRQIKPIDTFITRALLEGFLGLLVYAILLLGMSWFGLHVAVRDPLILILVFGLLTLGGMGLGMIFSVVVHYLPEAKTLIRLTFMPLYFISGIVVPLRLVPQEYLTYLLWNPVLHAIELNRIAFFEQYHGLYQVNFTFVIISVLACFYLGMAWYRMRRFDMVTL